MFQKGEWGAEMKPGVWREVSVAGDVYSLRQTRSAKTRGQPVSLLFLLFFFCEQGFENFTYFYVLLSC